MVARIAINHAQVAGFCERWRIAEISLFGSVLRDDFNPESDIDVLVDFPADASWSLLDLVRMEDDLATVFGRPVHLVTRRAVERSSNWIRRRAILESAERLHVA